MVAAALPYAADIDEISAFSGRISSTRKGEVIICGQPDFGASLHLAKSLICVRKYNPEIGCAATLRE